MKCKKIISALAAITMISSMGITCVNAKTSDNPIVHVTVTEQKDIAEKENYKVPDGYTAYMVSYALEGVDFVNDGGDDNEDLVAGLTIKFKITGSEYIHGNSYLEPVLKGAASKKNLNGMYDYVEKPTLFDNKQISFASTSGMDFYDWDNIPTDFTGTEKTVSIIDTLVYVETGKSVTYDYITQKEASGQTNSKLELLSGATYDEALVFQPASITLGTSAVKNEITGIAFNSASSLPTTLSDGDSFDFAATVAYTGTVDTTVKYTASVDGAEATAMTSSTYTATATTAEQTVTVTATANGDTSKTVSHTFKIPAKKAQSVVWEKLATVDGGKKIHTWKATVGTDATFITVKKGTESRNINGIAENGFALEDGAFRVFGIAIVTSADQDAFEFTINK